MSQRPRCRWWVAGALGWAVGWVANAGAGECIDYRNYMHWSPPIILSDRALDVHLDPQASDRAFVATDVGISLLSLANPNAPATLDSLDLRRAGRLTPGQLTQDAGTLWLAAGPAGLFKIATDSLRLQSWIDTPGEPQAVAIANGIAVVADWDQGLQLYDATTTPPIWLGGLDLPGFAAGVVVAGNLAYIPDLVSLTVVDISVASAPAVIGSIALDGEVWDVAIRDHFAYVATSIGLRIVDISDPAHMTLIDGIPLSGQRICLSENRAMIRGQLQFSIVDLSDPTDGKVILSTDLFEEPLGMEMVDGRLFLAGYAIRVLDLQNPTIAPVCGQINDYQVAGRDIAIDGTLACIGDHDRVSLVDVSNPAAPLARGWIEISDCRMVAAGDGLAFIVRGTGDCLVIDCSVPESPVQVGEAKVAPPSDCALESGHLYLVSETQGLQILDVSVPSAPVMQGVLDIPGMMLFVAASPPYLYIGGADVVGHARLLIVDASDPAAPEAVGAYEFPGFGGIGALAVSGTRVHMLVDSFGGIPRVAIIDASDSERPALLGELETPFDLSSGRQMLAVVGEVAYLASNQGILVLDVSDPASPSIIGSHLGTRPNSMVATTEYIYANRANAFVVLPTQCQTPSPVELASFEAASLPGAIQLTWRTSREWDHLGFYVERALAAGGVYERLSERIPPPGPYAYLDRTVTPGVTYYYRLAALDRSGRTEFHGPIPATAAATNAPPPKPITNTLAQNHPNPFLIGDRTTAIAYTLAASGRAKLRIFDATGRLVATLVDAELPEGEHLATWDGRTVRGESAPAGTYFYQLEAGDFTATQQLVRLR